MPNNQMSLHTTAGCTHPVPVNETGVANGVDCSTPAGCTVTESSPNSFESGFALVGGGVWACQFDVAGIFIWFWSRPNVPASITSANSTSPIDISQWGTPSASYPSTTCNITEFFTPQNLVIDITLCGNWAGIGPVYNATCGASGTTGLCYNDNVVGPGSPKYDNAYFEISYVRAYTTPNPPATSTTTSASDPTTTSATPVVITAPPTAQSTTVSGSANGAQSARDEFAGSWGYLLCVVGMVLGGAW